jgi:RNA polymerase sigma-70 factor (ECF subfamily)
MSDETWRRAHEAARTAWPEVALPFDAFRAHGRRLGLPDAPTEPHLAETYLVCAALAGNRVALEVLETRFLAPARASIRRIHAEPDFVDEALQELRQKLLVGPEPRLLRYLGRSPLEGWIRVTATRLAFDLARQRVFGADEAGGDKLEQIAAEVPDADLALLKRKLGESFQRALRAALDSLEPRERNVLRMHLGQGLSIDDIARPHRVHRATAARWLNDIKRKVFEIVRAQIVGQYGPMNTTDLDSLAGLVRSQLHVSLARLGASRVSECASHE